VITSCSPGWIKFMERIIPTQGAHLDAKSPQQMFGTLRRPTTLKRARYRRRRSSPSPSCVQAKKFEAQRPEMNASGFQDVDYVLTRGSLPG